MSFEKDYMFLEEDKQEASDEQNCYEHCLEIANKNHLEGNFEKAAIYLENAARSQNRLEYLKNKKQLRDRAEFLLKQIDHKRQQVELLNKMAVNIYE